MNLRGNAQRIVYWVLLGLVVVNLPVYLFFVRPEHQAAIHVSVRIQQTQQELQNKLLTIERLKGMESKLQESARNLKEFEQKYLFTRGKLSSELIKELDQICSQAGLVRNRMAFNSSAEAEFGMQRISFTLPIEGSYSNIRKFLNILESRPKLVVVESMVLESEKEGTGLIQMDMNLSTFYPVEP